VSFRCGEWATARPGIIRIDDPDARRSGTVHDVAATWPELSYAGWAGTKRTVHLCTQMLGKARIALGPVQPEWMHTCLHTAARGLTTGPLPLGDRSVQFGLDVFEGALTVRVSDGRSATVPISGGRTIADIYREFTGTAAEMGVSLDLWDRPQEVSDTTPFHEDTRRSEYDPAAVRRWFDAVTAVANVFGVWQGRFLGRSSVQFWWGAFDFAVLRFSGRKAEPPQDRGYIMRYDLDAEFMNAGFWPGDESAPDPIFYAYINPTPPGCDLAPIDPDAAAWIETMGEWVLPYEAVRTSGDPCGALLDFLDSVYAVAGANGGWDLTSYEYVPPAPSTRTA
jgi:hypothetical protein